MKKYLPFFLIFQFLHLTLISCTFDQCETSPIPEIGCSPDTIFVEEFVFGNYYVHYKYNNRTFYGENDEIYGFRNGLVNEIFEQNNNLKSFFMMVIVR